MNHGVLKIADLKPQPRNPNSMSKEQFELLKTAISKEGFLQPILASLWQGVYWIVDGHHRVKAAQMLGFTSVPAFVGSWDRQQMELIQLGMNRNRGHVSLDLAEEILRELSAAGLPTFEMVGVSGFSQKELEALLRPIEIVEEELTGLPEPMPDVAAKPFSLELVFTDEKQLKTVQKKLRKAAGASKDMSLGLLNLLGMVE